MSNTKVKGPTMIRGITALAIIIALAACTSEASRTLEEANDDANRSYLERLAEDSDRVEIDEEGNAVWSDLEGDELRSHMETACKYYHEAMTALDNGDRDAAYESLIWARKNSEGTPAEEPIREMFDTVTNFPAPWSVAEVDEDGYFDHWGEGDPKDWSPRVEVEEAGWCR